MKRKEKPLTSPSKGKEAAVTLEKITENFTFFAARPDQKGGGTIILTDTSCRVVPGAECAWPELRNGNWRIKPLGEDGRPTFLFLLTRAYVISQFAVRAQDEVMAPASDQEEAWGHIQMEKFASAWSHEARITALSSSEILLNDEGASLISHPRDFIGWFEKSFQKMAREPENAHAVKTMTAYDKGLRGRLGEMVQAARDSQRIIYSDVQSFGVLREFPDVSTDVLFVCRAIRQLTEDLRQPPTQAALRASLSKHPNIELADTAAGTNRFGELLAKAGFQWLPRGKAGRPRR